MRCRECRAEFLVALRCKGRHFCPSCHARRLAEWSRWLDEHLLAAVAHRQVVLTLPKRLRAYFIYDRRGLGRLSRVANETLREYVSASLDEAEAGPGVIGLVQTGGQAYEAGAGAYSSRGGTSGSKRSISNASSRHWTS